MSAAAGMRCAARVAVRVLLLACIGGLGASAASAQTPADLRVGQWVEVKGDLDVSLGGERRFRASEVEVQAPQENHVLIGTVQRVDRLAERFFVLGQEVHVDDSTQWKELTLARLQGTRVKVEGHYRGPSKFSGKSVAARGAGRDRLSGRIDALEKRDGALELRVIDFTIVVPLETKLASAAALDTLALAPHVAFASSSASAYSDDEDLLPGTLRLADDLYLGGLLEYKGERERGFDLDDSVDRDRTKQRFALRAQLTWTPSRDFRAVFSPRYEFDDRRVDGGGADSSNAQPHVNELYGEWDDVGRSGFDFYFGRQLFDDGREWIYKRNLDALRVVRNWDGGALELSWSRVLDDGSDRDKHTQNWMAYLSNGDPDRQLALYVVDRRDERATRNDPILFGARAVGEFLPDLHSWTEVGLVRGYGEDTNFYGYGFDVGATWKPDPWRLTLGYAFGSGDKSSTSTRDESFQQSGLQNDNDKVGGASSMRYYGEIVDPELSNLSILTAGLGFQIVRRTTIELVWHRYQQVEPATFLRDSSLDMHPDGASTDLGTELDLLLSSKSLDGWEFKLLGGWFDPGRAFPGGDPAWLGAFTLRWRF